MNDMIPLLQTNIFGETESPAITIEIASTEAQVSNATIRNWIKTGYLQSPSKGLISKKSFNIFMQDIAGKPKKGFLTKQDMTPRILWKQIFGRSYSL